MATIKFSPNPGFFSANELPKDVGNNQTTWFSKNFPAPLKDLSQSKSVGFAKTDLAAILGQPGCKQLVFSKIQVAKPGHDPVTTLAVAGVDNLSNLQIANPHHVFIGNKFDLPNHQAAMQNSDFKPVFGEPDKGRFSFDWELPAKATSFQDLMNELSAPAQDATSNFFLTVIFPVATIKGFVDDANCDWVAFVPVFAKRTQTEKTVNGNTTLHEKSSMMLETLAAFPVAANDDLAIADGIPVEYSDMPWPINYPPYNNA